MEKTNIFFIGSFYDSRVEKEILKNSLGKVHNAANTHQKKIIEGIEKIYGLPVKVISAPFISSFPIGYKKIYFKNRQKTSSIRYVDFINIWGLKNIHKAYQIKKIIKNLKISKNKRNIIFVYSPHTPFISAAEFIKKRIDPCAHVCFIVPDMPHFMNLKEQISYTYKFLKRLDILYLESKLSIVDSFVFLTLDMNEIMNQYSKPFIVSEGMVSLENNFHLTLDRDKGQNIKTTICYTGSLDRRFGILNLLEAFHGIETEDIELRLCGQGDAIEEVLEYVKRDSRIVYYGQLSHSETLTLQGSSTILINPRQNNGEYTKYSFPSKLMEYLLSARPIICYKLDGIPNEYDEYFFYVENNTIEALQNKIIEVMNVDAQKLDEIGLKGRNYVLEEKNNIIFAKKLKNMIDNT